MAAWERCLDTCSLELFRVERRLERLSTVAPANKKFCFFIDGLDEYDDDHFDLIDLMFKTVKNEEIKICLSSRPWNCFGDAFGTKLRQKLYL